MRLPSPELEQVLTSGLKAPSADNHHRLRFGVSGDEVDLLSTDAASWQDQPHRQCLALLSYGAVLENMALRSSALGYFMQAQWLPDPARPALIAKLHWHRSSAPPDGLHAFIDGRHTNRRFYRRAAASTLALSRVTAAARDNSFANLLWLTEVSQRTTALRALRLAETHRFQRRGLHDELFGSIRFEQGWQRSTEEGLPPGALEVEPPLRPMFALLRHWPLMRVLNGLGMAQGLGWRAGYLPCALAPHLGLIRADSRLGPVRWLHAGRTLERVWLAATAEGLALQPMAAATVLTQQRPSPDGVSATTRARLQHLLDAFSDETQGQAGLFFRLGLARAPSVVTQRPALAAFIAPCP